jgi:SPP1 gp7 family putative phage head morphogenesis protein
VMDDKIGNADNRGRILVLSDAEFTPNGLAPKDMEFRTLLVWVRELASALTGVPLPCVGVFEDANFSMYDAALRAMWTGPNGVLAFLASVERVLNESFFPRLADPKRSKWRAYFDTSNVQALQVDRTAQIEAAARTSTQVGIPFNASLALYGVDVVVEGGDEVYDPLAGMDIGDGEETPADTEGATPGDPNTESVTGEGVQTQLLNGAQMQTAVDIVAQVTSGEIPRDSAQALLETLLGLTSEQALAILGSAQPRDPEEIAATPEAASKSYEFKDARDLDTREKRVAYWEAVEKKVHQPGEAIMLAAARKLLKLYEEAQLARIRAFAKGSNSAKAMIAKAREMTAAEAEIAERVRVLMLNREEWEQKMARLFDAPIKRVSSLALTATAEEIGGISIGIGDPRIVEAMARQSVQLVEGVTSTLAQRVQTTLVRELSKASSIADLQAAVKEVLPELEGALATQFANRDARAQVIARTEAGHAAKTARFEQFKADGIKRHRWITQGDSVVREEHAAVDNEVRALGEPFSNGLRYPQDPNGSASQVISCRCTLAPVFEGEE